MSDFRFLHAADIHLDSPLRGLDGHDEEIARRICTAPRAEVFINFDADRAAAGFPILGELTRSPQVLGFTRHEHRVEIARARARGPRSSAWRRRDRTDPADDVMGG